MRVRLELRCAAVAALLLVSVLPLPAVAAPPPPQVDCVQTLAPALTRSLDPTRFARPQSVAWNGASEALVATHGGIAAYDLRSGAARVVVPGDSIPVGIPDVVGVAGDGARLIAFNLDYSDVVADARSGRIVAARRDAVLQIADVAIRGDVAAVLAYPLHLRGKDLAQLWVGEPGAPWDTFVPLHVLSPEAAETIRYAMAPYGGAVTFDRDGSIAMISPAERGVFRYRPDGTALPTLGRNVSELVVPELPRAIRNYALDLDGRYREVFNRQPTIDDLVTTSDGLAIVVRLWHDGKVHWQLWFPDADRIRRRIALGISDTRVAGGHLHCSGRGTAVICAFGRFTAPKQPPTPELDVFELTDAKGCK